MTTWFTADLHLGHSNIIKYCDRPYHDVDAMNRALVDNWNRVVDDTDTVWVLGDFALGKIAKTLPVVAELHGHKILVAGNHDRCWHGHRRRADAWTERYLDAGFDEIVQGSTKTKIADTTVLLCHFPYRGDSHNLDRFVDHRPTDKGAWLLHGHVHEKWAQSGRMINVGVDAHNFEPVNSSTLAQLMVAGPSNLATV